MKANKKEINLKKGDTFRDRDYKYHVVAVLEDEPDIIIVFKYYGKHKQWWHYMIKDIDDMRNWFLADLYKDLKQ